MWGCCDTIRGGVSNVEELTASRRGWCSGDERVCTRLLPEVGRRSQTEQRASRIRVGSVCLCEAKCWGVCSVARYCRSVSLSWFDFSPKRKRGQKVFFVRWSTNFHMKELSSFQRAFRHSSDGLDNEGSREFSRLAVRASPRRPTKKHPSERVVAPARKVVSTFQQTPRG